MRPLVQCSVGMGPCNVMAGGGWGEARVKVMGNRGSPGKEKGNQEVLTPPSTLLPLPSLPNPPFPVHPLPRP